MTKDNLLLHVIGRVRVRELRFSRPLMSCIPDPALNVICTIGICSVAVLCRALITHTELNAIDDLLTNARLGFPSKCIHHSS